jgi:cysteinyl-tRNA synthetase, unknown class
MSLRSSFLVRLGLVVLLTSSSTVSNAKPISAAQTRAQLMSKVKTWGYQLQRLDVRALTSSPFDLLVIDHAPDRVESVELMFKPSELASLKTKTDGSRRLVLSYVSIGEAERYRFYWNETWLDNANRPSWLGAVNPQWVGNYPVEFWNNDWQKLIYGHSDSYIDRVLDAGFDGIYLDRADVYEQFKNRPNAQEEMVIFVQKLTDHARSIKPEALVILQNAEELMRNKDVRARIDAVAKESLYFNPDLLSIANDEDANGSIKDLKLAQKWGRKILLVEYLGDPALAKQVRDRADRQGFIVHFAERTLSSLNERGPDQKALETNAAPLRTFP